MLPAGPNGFFNELTVWMPIDFHRRSLLALSNNWLATETDQYSFTSRTHLFTTLFILSSCNATDS
jgi:hypothetical protein